jgi:hypothetical protein
MRNFHRKILGINFYINPDLVWVDKPALVISHGDGEIRIAFVWINDEMKRKRIGMTLYKIDIPDAQEWERYIKKTEQKHD